MLFQVAGIEFEYEPHSAYVSDTLSPFAVTDEPRGLPGEGSPIRAIIDPDTCARYAAEAKSESPTIGDDVAESFGVMHSVSDVLFQNDGMFLHSAAMSVDGMGYAICAPSGRGKSTQLRLWRELLGDRMRVINGDRPFLRWSRGRCYLCGSPWCGKEGWGENIFAPLGAIAFLERAEGRPPHVEKVAAGKAIPQLLRQTVRLQTSEQLDACCAFLERLVAETPLYQAFCNVDVESARLTFQTLSRGGTSPCES